MNKCFSQSYAEARTKILATAELAAASVRTILHPCLGPAGEALAMDIESVGNPVARNVLVMMAGVHGVEGYGGSGVMISLLS